MIRDRRFRWTAADLDVLQACYSRGKGRLALACAALPSFSRSAIASKASVLAVARVVTSYIPDGVCFDERDRNIIEGHYWTIDGEGYVAASIGDKTVRLHRHILKPKRGEKIDHRNGDKLDNRRSNLRLATDSVNCHNTKARLTSRSRIKNVYFYPAGTLCKTERYVAQITVDRRVSHLGTFRNADDAIASVKAWREKHIPDHDVVCYGQMAHDV